MSSHDQQFGAVKETTWNTPVTVSRFFEVLEAPIKPVPARVESAGIRAGSRVARSTNFQTYTKGGSGSAKFEVPTKGFGFWLEHMLGGTVTTTGPTDANYTHTAKIGSLTGKGLTAQTGVAFNPAEGVQAFTFSGGKVTGWELSMEVEGLLICSLDFDFASSTTATGLATASYPSGFNQFAWTGASIAIGGTQICLNKFSVKGDNKQATDKYMLCGTSTKHEPTENDLRAITWDAECEFADLTQYNRVMSATRAGALASIVATFTGPEIHGGATYPQLVVTLPAARFDDGLPAFSGLAPNVLGISGVALDDLSGTTACQISYRTTDATP